MAVFLQVYALVITPSKIDGVKHFYSEDNAKLSISSGNIEFTEHVMDFTYTDHGSSMMTSPQEVRIKGGTHLLVEVGVFSSGLVRNRAKAVLLGNSIAAMVDLTVPDVIRNKVFEGFVDAGDGLPHFELEGPINFRDSRLYPKKPTLNVIEASLKLTKARRNDPRIELASRWFMRGKEAVNYADKVLFWWTVLEIFPAENTSSVPEKVAELFKQHIFTDSSERDIKKITGIGRLFGLRTQIVHNGRAFLENNDETSNQLEQLEKVVRNCLAILSGVKVPEEFRFTSIHPNT